MKCLALVSTKVYCTEPHPDRLRPGTAGAQLGDFQWSWDTGLILQLTELLEIWPGTKKKICWVVCLSGVSKSIIIPVTQVREVGAGQEQMGMFFYYTWLETEVREKI